MNKIIIRKARLENEVVGFCRYDYYNKNDEGNEDNVDCELRAYMLNHE